MKLLTQLGQEYPSKGSRQESLLREEVGTFHPGGHTHPSGISGPMNLERTLPMASDVSVPSLLKTLTKDRAGIP